MAVCAAYRLPHSRFLAWSEDDRNKAIAWYLRERDTCPSCGTRPEEWDGGRRRAYRATEHRCHGCEEIERHQAAIASDEWMSRQRGLKTVLVRTEEVGRGAEH